MGDTTTIRVSRATHGILSDLAARSGESVTETVARAVRLLEQELIGADLAVPLRADELDWLNADGG